MGGYSIKQTGVNYSWNIKNVQSNMRERYDEWRHGRCAHEKIADLDLIKAWDRNTLLEFVAGIIDTDGSVFVDSWSNLTISVSMQTKPVIAAQEYAFMALWQTPTTRTLDNGDKYKNEPCYGIKVASNDYSKRIIKELDNHTVCPSKKWKESYSDLVSKRSSPFWIGTKLGKSREVETYDIHVDSETNLYLLANGLVTHNSGKSQTMVRDYTWKLGDNHPYWKRRTGSECPSCKSSSTISLDKAIRSYQCGDCSFEWVYWEGDKIILL